MSDLISRQAAIEVLRNRWLKTRNYDGIGEDIAEECEIYLKTLPSAQPTVDAVPVIRCRDCKLWMKNPYRESSVFGLCFKHKDIAIATDETDWCSWAERRTDETD